jgi:hypothetical protein
MAARSPEFPHQLGTVCRRDAGLALDAVSAGQWADATRVHEMNGKK